MPILPGNFKFRKIKAFWIITTGSETSPQDPAWLFSLSLPMRLYKPRFLVQYNVTIQGDQLYKDVCFWNLIKSDLSRIIIFMEFRRNDIIYILDNRGLNQWAGKARGGKMASVYGAPSPAVFLYVFLRKSPIFLTFVQYKGNTRSIFTIIPTHPCLASLTCWKLLHKYSAGYK